MLMVSLIINEATKTEKPSQLFGYMKYNLNLETFLSNVSTVKIYVIFS